MKPDPIDPRINPKTGEPWTPVQRVKRGLARRFPATASAFLWVVAKTRHYAGRVVYRIGAIPRTLAWAGALLGDTWRLGRERRLTVAVDVTPLWESLTGVGWYLYRVLEQLPSEPDVEIRLYGPNILSGPDVPDPVVPLPTGASMRRVAWEVPHDLIFPAGWVMSWLRLAEPLLIPLHGNRVLFAPNYFLPRRFLLARGKRVATVHDLGLHKVPDTLQQETKDALESNLRRFVNRAERLISVSAAVRSELVEFGYARADRVDVIHHGPGQLAAVEAGALPQGVETPYALHVGTLEPRKNILGLLRAWKVVVDRGIQAPLVICGRFGWKSEEIADAIRKGTEEGWVLHLGYVEEDELASLYENAAVVVFPTHYEGFGLPAVEAQLAGAPLVCSDIPVLREVAGDGARFADGKNPEALADAIIEVLENPEHAETLRRLGRENAGRLSWGRAAELTVSTWRRAAGEAA